MQFESNTSIVSGSGSASHHQTILTAMTLAPSAHNTQPWLFSVRDNHIDVHIDWSRHLRVSDPTHRELYISLGCPIANAIVAAEDLRFKVDVAYFPDGEGEEKPVARLTLIPDQPEPAEDALFRAIRHRRTDRSRYDGQPLQASEKAALASARNPWVLLIEDRRLIEEIGRLTEEGTFATLSRPDFKEELSHWVRNDWTRLPDGMPGYATGLPAPLSLVSSVMVRLAPIHKQEAPKTRQQIVSASAVAVIGSPQDTPTDWLKVGQLLQTLWLEATVTGLAAAPIVSAIEASPELRQKLQTILGTNLLPQSLIRIGHSARRQLRPTPRRSVANCLR